MKRDLAIRALKRAVAPQKPPKNRIQHMDRGSQYCSCDCQKLLRQHGFQVPMSGKGNCYDNSAVETFFKTITKSRQFHSCIWHRLGKQMSTNNTSLKLSISSGIRIAPASRSFKTV